VTVDMKDRIIVALIVVSVLLLIGMINFGSKSRQTRIARDKEMNIRFDAQADLYSIQKENSLLRNKLEKTEGQLNSLKNGLDSAQKSLAQQQQINQDLRAEIEKIAGINNSLEEELKNANAAKSGRQSKK